MCSPPAGVSTPVDKVSISGIPYRMSPMLSKLLDKQISSLVYSSNIDIRYGLIDPIKLVKQTSSLDHIAHNWSNVLGPSTPRYQFISVARRAALGYFWRRTVRKCISKLASSESKEVCRQMFCPPVGLHNAQYTCRSVFCPHCRMRTANLTRKEIQKHVPDESPEKMTATVVTLDVPFKERFYGFDAVIEDVLVGKITRRMRNFRYFGIKVLGAKVKDRRPIATTSVALIINPEDREKAAKKMKRLKTCMFRENPGWFIDVQEVDTLDSICLALYDSNPVSLVGVAEDGLSNQMMQHTLDSYKTEIKSKKRISFFGTGVK